MRSASAWSILIAAMAVLFSTTPLPAEDFSFELEPDATVGNYGAVNLHGWLEGSERLAGARMVLEFDPAKVANVRVRVPDALKSPELVTEASLTASGAEAAVSFAPAVPPVTSRTKVFTVRLCMKAPTPHAGWEFPLEVASLQLSFEGREAPVTVPIALPEILVNWGTNWTPCDGAPEPPEFFTCTTQPGGEVLLTWQNAESYDLIEIIHSRQQQVFLPGDATSWVHPEGGAGTNYTYSIHGKRYEGERSHWSDSVTCAAEDPRPRVSFLRGDANSDGSLSTADIIAIQRWLFTGEDAPTCMDAADVNDDGAATITDEAAIGYYLFQMQFGSNSRPFEGGAHPPAPFPGPGPDPTHFGEQYYMSCDSYDVIPPEVTEDAIRIGDVEAGSGTEVLVPVYLTNSVPVDAVQLVVRYDPSVLRIDSGRDTLTYEGTHYGQFAGRFFTVNYGNSSSSFTFDRPHITQVDADPAQGVFTASIVSSLFFAEVFQVPPGEDTIVAKIRVEVSPDVPPGTTLHLDPYSGPEGSGHGPFRLHNEITYRGEGRYATILPREIGGVLRIGVDGDISFFRRGDANGDEKIDISDAVSVLGYLFLGSEVACEDAADADDSGDLLITDGIVILMHLFSGSERLPQPYPEPGPDPRPDFLGACATSG